MWSIIRGWVDCHVFIFRVRAKQRVPFFGWVCFKWCHPKTIFASLLLVIWHLFLATKITLQLPPWNLMSFVDERVPFDGGRSCPFVQNVSWFSCWHLSERWSCYMVHVKVHVIINVFDVLMVMLVLLMLYCLSHADVRVWCCQCHVVVFMLFPY